MHAIIAGGGIAGLTCAMSLHQVGIACRVYDAVPKLAPLGYGINLQPNAVRELTALGLGELAFYNKHGQLTWTEPRGRAAGYRWPQISISRGKLHEILLGAIRERMGVDAVVPGHRLTSFEPRGDRVIARFSDPKGGPAGEAEGDILIGADGIHSTVRQRFYPGEKAVFDGYLHYRGMVETGPYLTGASMVVVGHRHHRAIIYPIGARPGGKVMVNWLAYTKIPPGSPPLEAWDTAADKEACLAQYKGWTYPWLDVHGLFAATPAEVVLQLPNVDRDPVPRWSFGRVTLIGDAAHPMQPVGAQAGSQAIVDGRVLAASLLETRDPAEALTRYQDRRIAAMNDMILRNRSLGLETILQTAEERAPQGFKHIHDVLSQEELEFTALNYKRAAGFDLEVVNSRESFVVVPTHPN
jgi:5-methylphenazine-1-carboxylate 1-monooxygenase